MNPSPQSPFDQVPTHDLSREHVLRLGRLCAAVVCAGALMIGTGAAADAATHPNKHAKHTAKHHAGKHHRKHAATKRHPKAWVATGANATLNADGSVSTVTDPTGDVSSSGSLNGALSASGTARADTDLTHATVVRQGHTVQVTVDTASDYAGQQSLEVAGLLDVAASEAFHLAIHAAGSTTVYSATATVDGAGQLSAGSAARVDADGSVTFTVPVAALPRDAQLHVDLTSDLGASATLLGGLVRSTLTAHLGDTLDFGFHTGS